MQDETPHTVRTRVTQWSNAEITLLRQLARTTTRKAELRRMFPGRTLGAIKKRLSDERRALGVVRLSRKLTEEPRKIRLTVLDRDDPGLACDYPRRWAESAISSNQTFLAALAAAA